MLKTPKRCGTVSLIKHHQNTKKINTIVRYLILAAVIFLMVFGVVRLINFVNTDILGNDEPLNVKTLTPPEYVDVQLITSPARNGKKLKQINDIVIHYVGNPNTTAQNNRNYFNNKTTNVCSHFVVGLEGEIIQCVPINEWSAASNNRNRDTISIEVCHEDSTGKFNEATYNALVKLTSWLCENSGLDETQIIRHYDITGKECPLYYVRNEDEWFNFKKDVSEALNEN